MAVYMYMKTGLINDTEEGPHSLDEMARLLADRVINPSTLCTRSGDSAWRTVGDYTEITARMTEAQQHAEAAVRQQHEQQQLLEQQQQAAEQQRLLEQQRLAAQQAQAAQVQSQQAQSQQAQSQQAQAAQHAAAASPFPQGSTLERVQKGSVNVQPRPVRRKTVLFDIFFTRFVTPTAVTALWILSIVGYVGGFLFLLISASVGSIALMASAEENGAATGGYAFLMAILYLLAYLLVGGLYLLIYRILLECIMVIFRCSQSLDVLAGREPPFEV